MASMVGSDSALRDDDLDAPVLRFTHAHWRRHTWILPLNWLVIEIASVNGEYIVIVRFRGRLSVSDLSVFETAPPIDMRGIKHIRVLFDWTGIEGWEPRTREPALWPNWRAMARPIDRAAIIHEHRWNRQAALLAATLRINKAQARSWLPRNLPTALVWLNEK
jgi:hypothetical protein